MLVSFKASLPDCFYFSSNWQYGIGTGPEQLMK